jgi:hypothetical protein
VAERCDVTGSIVTVDAGGLPRGAHLYTLTEDQRIIAAGVLVLR